MRPFQALLTVLCLLAGPIMANAADRFALLIGVSKYDHAEMNKPEPLRFPEDDAKSLGELLKAGGYEIETLLGKKATRKTIEAKLTQLSKKGSSDSIVLIGLFGHGVEIETRDDQQNVAMVGCFCPFDTGLRAAKDSKGRNVLDQNGQPLTEPDPDSLIRMADIMLTLKLAKARNRVVVADCCRTVPNQARGRSFGAGFRAQDLPENTSVLFGCSPNERAFEHPEWGHGAFTKCLLEAMNELANEGEVETARLAGLLRKRVPQLVATVAPRDTQTPKLFSTDIVDLRLSTKGLPTPSSSPPRNPKEITSKSTGMKLILIPAGEFMMGSSADDVDRLVQDLTDFKREYANNERPQHRVKISKPFYMGQHEVTLREFLIFCNDANYKVECERDGKGGSGYNAKDRRFDEKPSYRPWSWGFEDQTQQHPVVNVSWNDAKAFCDWLSKKDGRTYRLPTEAEWEYACRAGTTTRHPGGDDTSQLARIANVGDQSASRIPGLTSFVTVTNFDDGYRFTAPVGSFAANAFGLYDMIGNVNEWCEDVFDDDAYKKRVGAAIDPWVKSGSDLRTYRGSAWTWGARDARSALRWDDHINRSFRRFDVGFRVVSVQQ